MHTFSISRVLRGMLAVASVSTLSVVAAGQTVTPDVFFNHNGTTTGFIPYSAPVEFEGGFWTQTFDGKVLKVSSSGALLFVRTIPGTIGTFPHGNVLGVDPNTIYGITSSGTGAVWKMNTVTGTFTNVKPFSGLAGGVQPFNGLVSDPSGNLYGQTSIGGTSNRGTLYKISPAGVHTVLRSFGAGEGRLAYPAVVYGSDGVIYGSTYQGGTSDAGTIYKINPDGTGFQILHHFNGTNGRQPSTMIEGLDGYLYGGTISGGHNNAGVLYKISKTGDFTMLHSFTAATDGRQPSDPAMGLDGNIYCSPQYGGAFDFGTIVKCTPSGEFSVLYNFKNDALGGYPGVLRLNSDGMIYGACQRGGTGSGVLFRFTPPPTPDAVPPTTTATLHPASPDGANGWYKSAVQVSLSATDNDGGRCCRNEIQRRRWRFRRLHGSVYRFRRR